MKGTPLQAGNVATSASGEDLDPQVALEILRAIGDIRFGSVEVVVHGGKVVQIERKVKMRFAPLGETRK